MPARPGRRVGLVAGLIGTAMVALWSLPDVLPDVEAQERRGRRNAGASDYGIEQVRVINEQIRQGWADYQIRPSDAATEAEWCRRVYLDVVGRIPTVQEHQAFLQDSDPQKKLNLVNLLLDDEQYTEEYARNWTTVWTNILIGRSGGTERNSLTSRAGMQKYLRDSFARNTPYDQMVLELVTATGSTTPGSENFNGATNFLAMKVNEENATLATAQTSKIFLGMQIQCTQCHNHPFNDWKQQVFWEMNAFFRQTRALRRFQAGTRDVASAELVNQDFAGEGGTPEEAEIYYEQRNGILAVAYPVFIDGAAIGRSGFVQDVDRRTELGRLIVQSDEMSQAMVNRMWGHFLGYGFTKPVDDQGPHNLPTHPQLLDYLSQEFRDHSYNIKSLIRWITLSEAYSLSSRTNDSNVVGDDPLLGQPPKFSRFYLRPMQAEQLYESLLVATQAHRTRGSYEQQEREKAEWLRQFVVAFGNDEGEEATIFNGTITQALMMFNGSMIREATSDEQGSFLWNVAHSEMRPAEKIHYLFQAALGRRATRDEITLANQLLAARQGDHVAALQDLWWAVLNSNEFILVH